MYSKNVFNFVVNMLTKVKRGETPEFKLDQGDDIIEGTWMTKNGEVVHEAIKQALDASQGGQN